MGDEFDDGPAREQAANCRDREDSVSFKLLGAAALATVMAIAAPVGAAFAQDDQTIIMLGGPSSDPFWGAVQQGFNAAVAELGVKGQWTAPADFNDIVPVYTKMFEAAIALPSERASSTAVFHPSKNDGCTSPHEALSSCN